MSRLTCKQAVAVLALLATLSLAAPVPAHAAIWGPDGRVSGSVGSTWIAALWEQLTSLIRGGGKSPAAGAAARQRALLKSTTTTGSSGDNGISEDNGSMINPDG